MTWHAKHFGIYQKFTTKITELNYPFYFTDEMVKGIFKSFKHQHQFTEINGITKMTDLLIYEAPLGILGKIGDILFLKKYMTSFLNKRNLTIKAIAETAKWKNVLNYQ